MDELDEIKKRKLAELQRQQTESLQQQAQEQQQMQEQIQQLESFVKTHFSKEALQRYGNLKTVHPEKAIQTLVVLSQLIQQKGLQEVDDEMLKSVLKQLQSGEKEFNIKRK